jgi:hypothetical protein
VLSASHLQLMGRCRAIVFLGSITYRRFPSDARG